MLTTIHAAAEDIRSGRLSPVDLLDACLARIDRYEANVRAWVFVDRDAARAEAEKLTKELRRGERRGPLHGIPVGIKDIIDVFDWPTAAGSKLWAKSYARRDATVVERLRRAGAVLLGKTVTTAYASFDPPPTRNPWDLSRTPGGSSSGSAAALACGMCLGALGSQTGGSITRPASFCGVAGCKPTYSRVSTDGIVGLAPSMDHPGPMARSVRDLALLLETIAGPDVRDLACSDRPVPLLRPAAAETLPAPRLGRLGGLFDYLAEPATKALVDRVCQKFRDAGGTVTDLTLPAGFAEVLARHRTIMAVEAATIHGTRLQAHPDDYPPKVRGLIEEGLACPAPEYQRCKDFQRQLFGEMVGCFTDCDALLCPATLGPAPDAGSTGDPAFNSPWSLTGLPTVSLPAGRSPEGMPLAIQLIGPAWSEAELLTVAAWCEDKLNVQLGDPPG
jgi:Asp-tRNA(Asn)/Glu-tRNA(Gln) amidotransferase A subunit family amidase